jgi:uncharacterized UBP type Zn finger protein
LDLCLQNSGPNSEEQSEVDQGSDSIATTYTGLKNSDGRSCFLNSIVASLMSVLAIRETCRLAEIDQDERCVATALIKLMAEVQSGVRPRDSRKLMAELADLRAEFRAGQHDAVEALELIVSQLGEAACIDNVVEGGIFSLVGRKEDEIKECWTLISHVHRAKARELYIAHYVVNADRTCYLCS